MVVGQLWVLGMIIVWQNGWPLCNSHCACVWCGWSNLLGIVVVTCARVINIKPLILFKSSQECVALLKPKTKWHKHTNRHVNTVRCHLDRRADYKIVLRACDKRVVPDMRQRVSVANTAVAMDARIVRRRAVDTTCARRNAVGMACARWTIWKSLACACRLGNSPWSRVHYAPIQTHGVDDHRRFLHSFAYHARCGAVDPHEHCGIRMQLDVQRLLTNVININRPAFIVISVTLKWFFLYEKPNEKKKQ